MATRKSIYESYGFTCNPSYSSFNKELSESESAKLVAILERITNLDKEIAHKKAATIEKIFKYC